jgi:hypothetical protein
VDDFGAEVIDTGAPMDDFGAEVIDTGAQTDARIRNELPGPKSWAR